MDDFYIKETKDTISFSFPNNAKFKIITFFYNENKKKFILYNSYLDKDFFYEKLIKKYRKIDYISLYIENELIKKIMILYNEIAELRKNKYFIALYNKVIETIN